MTREEIKKSGLLELYAMGTLDAIERKIVEEALEKHKDLRKELAEIEKSLLQYAQIHGVEPSPEVRKSIVENLRHKQEISKADRNNNQTRKGFPWTSLFILMTLSSIIALVFLFNNYKSLEGRYKILEEECDSVANIRLDQIAFYESALNPGNNTIRINPTEKYPESELVIYLNESDQRGFIQPLNLPDLENNESFQLWSLKGNDPPTPLDVFDSSNLDSSLFEIRYIENPDAYAITIEPKGGSSSPTLENLIGVFPVSS